METLMLLNNPILNIYDNENVEILNFDLLPFALRNNDISLPKYKDWVSSRALQLDRQYAKELINRYRLPQYDKYKIAKACRAFSLNDAYWIKDEVDTVTWETRNLFQNNISVSIIETSLSGRLNHTSFPVAHNQMIDELSPELTTWGVNAKAWIKEDGDLYLHKIGINEVFASEILDLLNIPHIHYDLSTKEQIDRYLSEPIKEWLIGVGERIVNSRLFTNEATSFVSFDEFSQFCEGYGMNAIEEAISFDSKRYYEMQVVDYILNNPDRHSQNWGFYMDNATGKLKGMALLFDHDKAFNRNAEIASLTTKTAKSLEEAAIRALPHLSLDFTNLLNAKKPPLMEALKWDAVLLRVHHLMGEY